MYKIIDRHFNVRAFRVKDPIVLTVTSDFELLANKKFIAGDIADSHFKVINNQIIYSSRTNLTTYIGEDVLENLGYLYCAASSHDDFIILMSDFELRYPNRSSKYHLYNIGDRKKIELFRFENLKNLYYNSSLLVFTTGYKISGYTLPTAVPLWQYDLSVLGEYTPFRTTDQKPHELLKFIGTWRNQLLVACSDGLILCLDINTGKEIRRFQECPEHQVGSIAQHKFHNAMEFVLDGENNLLMALSSYYYMEIELSSEHISIINLKETMKENNITFLRRSTNYAWDTEYIYSIGYVGGHDGPIAIGDKCLFLFNRRTHKIDWQYIFEEDSISIDIPQLSGNKLYQLSVKKTLYVFEKEEVTLLNGAN
jgi:hypothetical protein